MILILHMPPSAVLITMIAIAIQRPGNGHVDATTKTDVATGFLAVTNIVFAYGKPCPFSQIGWTPLTETHSHVAGHVAFFGFISEMKIPTDYPKTLYLLQATDTSMYVVAAVVIYIYGGNGGKHLH